MKKQWRVPSVRVYGRISQPSGKTSNTASSFAISEYGNPCGQAGALGSQKAGEHGKKKGDISGICGKLLNENSS
jgi:hypothetical protein